MGIIATTVLPMSSIEKTTLVVDFNDSNNVAVPLLTRLSRGLELRKTAHSAFPASSMAR